MGDRRGNVGAAAWSVGVVLCVFVLACALLLGGCGGGGGATPRPTPTPSTASPSPSPTTARQQVEATARAYYAAIAVAASSGDTADFLAVTTDECRCRRLTERVRELFAGGGSTSGVSIGVTSFARLEIHGDVASASVKYRSSDYVIHRANGDTENVDERRGSDLLTLQRRNGRWLVAEVLDLTR